MLKQLNIGLKAPLMACAFVALFSTVTLTTAQTASHAALTALTESAWRRNADFLTRDSELSLLRAKQTLNQRRTPESGAVDVGTSRSNQGGQGYELAYTVPLWLSNERQISSQSLLAQAQGLETKLLESKWRVAGEVRSLYWAWQLAKNDAQFAQLHANNAAQLLSDVKRRVAAGDMTSADAKQAEIVQLTSLVALNEAKTAEQITLAQLQARAGVKIDAKTLHAATPEVIELSTTAMLDAHPVMASIGAKLAQLSRAQQLEQLQTRARTEVTVGTSRDKGASGDRYQSNLRLGVKIPLTNAGIVNVAVSNFASQQAALQVERTIESQRLQNEQSLALSRLNATAQQATLAQQRADAAGVLQGMIQKAFSYGEIDLPTRIRTAIEDNESQRLLAKSALEKAAATSAYKQILGLLP